MQRRYDRYGFRTRDIETARHYVEGALGVEMSQRDSGYWGLYYCTHGESGRRPLMLFVNERPYRYISEHREFGVVLDVNDAPDMDVIRERLLGGPEGPVHLRTRVLEVQPGDEEDES